MKILEYIVAVAALCFLAGCTIESDIILPDPTAAGDVMPGFKLDGPTRVETFDSTTGSYKAFATFTPERETEAVRYIVSLDDGTPNRLVVQARKMSENNYLIRFSQRIEGMPASLDESGLGFIAVKDGTYYLMRSISEDGWLEEIFGDEPPPRGGGASNVRLDTMDQALKISAWFAANYSRLGDRRDYVRFRIAE